MRPVIDLRRMLDLVFKRLIREGTLDVTWPGGITRRYGPGGMPKAGLALRDSHAVRGLLLNPGLAIGEAYMDGSLEPVGCTLYELLDLLMLNVAQGGNHPALRARRHVRYAGRRLRQFNPAWQAQRNVAHHYDLDARLYTLLLDTDLQYSCAYFETGDETLEEAQAAKKRHIATKLLLDRPDLEVLDIGCGWGGLALTLARDHGARVTGITLSQEQLMAAQARAAAEGLADRVQFQLRDYRSVTAVYDRIVSVGMFEHVGINHYGTFFDTVARCLRHDGVALLHTIGQSGPPAETNAWLSKYIFPGGYSPSLSEIMPGIERSGLIVTDIEMLRLHYARTIAHWRQRFALNRDRIEALYDERFCRMFEFYLVGSELAFRRENELNFQIQLCHQHAAVPLTRDYMHAAPN
ncbi:MAG: class I SAM-dependent methyltransferase [Janthinobacterium lividum]